MAAPEQSVFRGRLWSGPLICRKLVSERGPASVAAVWKSSPQVGMVTPQKKQVERARFESGGSLWPANLADSMEPIRPRASLIVSGRNEWAKVTAEASITVYNVGVNGQSPPTSSNGWHNGQKTQGTGSRRMAGVCCPA